MGKIFYILGKSASGKDSIFHELKKDPSLGLKGITMYTTRPRRVDEIDGEDFKYADKWSKIKIVLDTVKKCSEVYLDGTLVKVDNSLTANHINYIRITYSCGVKSDVDTEVFAFAIDNWRVYKEYPLPAISNVTAYDTNANSASLSEGSLISNSVNKFELDLSNSIYANTDSLLSNITLALGNIVVKKENAVLSDGVLTFDVSNLPENADLKLTIGANTALYDGTTICLN